MSHSDTHVRKPSILRVFSQHCLEVDKNIYRSFCKISFATRDFDFRLPHRDMEYSRIR